MIEAVNECCHVFGGAVNVMLNWMPTGLESEQEGISVPAGVCGCFAGVPVVVVVFADVLECEVVVADALVVLVADDLARMGFDWW